MLNGSCLCGAIGYQVTQLDTPIVHCSCQTCIKAHSAAFNTGAGVKPEHFKWTKGEEHLNFYTSSPGKKRYFCANCGSQLVAQKQGQAHLILRVATLDDDPGSQPVYQIWQSHEKPWLAYGGHLPSYAQWSDDE